MTGIFEVYIKTPRKGEVFIPPPPPMEGHDKPERYPDMKNGSSFDYAHLKDVEIPQEVLTALQEWWFNAKGCEEFIVRCELPV